MGMKDFIKRVITPEIEHHCETDYPSCRTVFKDREYAVERGPAEIKMTVTHDDLASSGKRSLVTYLLSKGVSSRYFEVPAGTIPRDRYGREIGVGYEMIFLDWLNPGDWPWKLYRMGDRQARDMAGNPAVDEAGRPVMEHAYLPVSEFPHTWSREDVTAEIKNQIRKEQ